MQQKKSRKEKKSFLPKRNFEIFRKYPVKLWIPFVLLIVVFLTGFFISDYLGKDFAKVVDLIININRKLRRS